MNRIFWAPLLTALLVVSTGLAQDSPPSIESIQRLLDENRTEQALAALEQRIATDQGDLRAHFLHGLVLLEQGDTDSARAVYLEISQRFPQLPEAFNNLAAIYVADGELELAREALTSARNNAPDYPLVHVNLGDLYLKLAADAYREAANLDPLDNDSAAKLDALRRLFGSGG